MPLAAGAAHDTPLRELTIKVVAYSSAPTGLISFALILWGLRRPATARRQTLAASGENQP
jgi:hydroxylaminobenzene mutase